MSDILGRIGNILRANLNDMLDHAEDPEKMIDQLVRDYTNDISEAESAVAQTVGNLRLAEDDLKRGPGRGRRVGRQGGRGRRSAPARPQAAGNTADAARFDDLAKAALRQQIAYEGRVKTLQEQVDQQTVQVDQLKAAPQRHARQARRAPDQARRARGPGQDGRGPAARSRSRSRASTASTRRATWAATRTRSARKRRWPRAWPRSAPHPSTPSSRHLDDDAADAEVETRLAALKGGSTTPGCNRPRPASGTVRGIASPRLRLARPDGRLGSSRSPASRPPRLAAA